MLLHRKILSESSVFMAASLVGLFGVPWSSLNAFRRAIETIEVLFLFDFGTGRSPHKFHKRHVSFLVDLALSGQEQLVFWWLMVWSMAWPACRTGLQRAGDQRRLCLVPHLRWCLDCHTVLSFAWALRRSIGCRCLRSHFHK